MVPPFLRIDDVELQYLPIFGGGSNIVENALVEQVHSVEIYVVLADDTPLAHVVLHVSGHRFQMRGEARHLLRRRHLVGCYGFREGLYRRYSFVKFEFTELPHHIGAAVHAGVHINPVDHRIDVMQVRDITHIICKRTAHDAIGGFAESVFRDRIAIVGYTHVRMIVL